MYVRLFSQAGSFRLCAAQARHLPRADRELRQALLSLDLVYLCLSERGIWTRAFAEHDITITESRLDGRLNGAGFKVRRAGVEVAKLRYGIAFSGISPLETARQLSERL